MKLTSRIKLLEIGSTQEAVPRPRVAKQSEPEPKVNINKAGTKCYSLLNELKASFKRSSNRKRGQNTGSPMKPVRAVLASTNDPEDRASAAVSE